MKTLWHDTTLAARGLRRTPGFACLAAFTLALAIGANTAVFTVVNGVLLRPLPFADADRLMVVSYWPPYVEGWLGAPALLGRDYVTFRRATHSFDRLAMIIPYGARLTGAGDARTIPGARVSADFFSVLGIKPAIGRTFAPDEGTSTGAGVVVISSNLWRERFASDSSVVGRTIVLDGQRQTVIGVMPDGFDFPRLPAQAPVRGTVPFPASEYWLAIAVDPAAMNYPGPVIGRLRPGVTPQQAQAELQAIASSSFVAFVPHQLWSLSPQLERGTTAQVLPLRDIYLTPPSLSPEESRDARKPLLFLAVAVALVLAIACSNVAGLMLMRTMSRTHDIAIRAALGASRRRLIQQSLVESLCISFVGAIAGVPLAWAGVRVLLSLAPSGAIPLADQVRVDGRVLTLAVAMVLVSGVFAGLAPAIFASRQSPQGTLGRGNRVSARHPVLEVAAAASLAFALILLTGAGLLVQSFLRLQAVRLGFEPQGVIVMRMVPPREMNGSPAVRRAFRDRALAELARLPQTAAVAAGTRYLVGASPGYIGPVTVEGRTTKPEAVWSNISPDYFRVLRMPLVAGRTFAADDDERAPPVAIVSQSFAANAWPGQSAIGKRVWTDVLTFPRKKNPDARDWVTVVGVVGDAIQGSITKPPPGIVYYPLNQLKTPFFPSLEVSLRTNGDPATAMRVMRQVMHEVAPDLPIDVLSPLSSLVGMERLQPLFQARLVAAFSLLAIMMAAVGTYSTLAYSVARRRHELAIRLALGAQPTSVVRLVMRRGALLAFVGVCVGVVGSFAVTRALQSVLFQTSAADPRVFAAAAAVLLVVAILACIVPTYRATRVDPIATLREV
jgi:putative ABC transport system permease protein